MSKRAPIIVGLLLLLVGLSTGCRKHDGETYKVFFYTDINANPDKYKVVVFDDVNNMAYTFGDLTHECHNFFENSCSKCKHYDNWPHGELLEGEYRVVVREKTQYVVADEFTINVTSSDMGRCEGVYVNI